MGGYKKKGLRKEKAFRMFMSVQSRFALGLVRSVLNFYFYLCLDIGQSPYYLKYRMSSWAYDLFHQASFKQLDFALFNSAISFHDYFIFFLIIVVLLILFVCLIFVSYFRFALFCFSFSV